MRIRAIKGSGEASSNHVSTPTSEQSKPLKRSQAIWASRASNEAIQLLSQLASQSANQPTNQHTNQSKKKLTDQPTNQPTKEPTNEPISLLTNHGADLPNYSQNKRLRPPVPRILHRRSHSRLRYVPTTVQLFIVVVSAATAVATTVQKFNVVG